MTDSALFRLAGLAGLLTGVLLLFNDLRREDLVPENALTESIAPIPALLALFTLTGLYLYRRRRVLALVGYALNFAGIAGLLVLEFLAHFVFAGLTTAEREDLVAGRTSVAFLVIAGVFAAGVVLFAVTSWAVYPRWAVVLYAVGFLLAAGRGAVPDPVVSLGFLLGSVGVLGLSWVLWTGGPVDRPVGATLRSRAE
ncbi:hypothetical protein [Cryptosporangium phraense]|uniref:DUF4386 family protein n=1 Tax=Cryptosporangium phraense TaxID=2593070 RepID=A0A545AZF5_9ACTN|nr:hypothetical protein [Cryptosporangium phraense]TQS46723.1 hypothetical protein FL583_00125 [Cryptosporangium phraense]